MSSINLVNLDVPYLSDEQKFWLRLEMERLDDSWKFSSGWRRQVPEQQFQVVIQKGVESDELAKRDRIMFNAGRYAQGARDQVAFNAHIKMQSILAAEEEKE
jgi:hypothetical protein